MGVPLPVGAEGGHGQVFGIDPERVDFLPRSNIPGPDVLTGVRKDQAFPVGGKRAADDLLRELDGPAARLSGRGATAESSSPESW
jgi:hypothetical protein